MHRKFQKPHSLLLTAILSIFFAGCDVEAKKAAAEAPAANTVAAEPVSKGATITFAPNSPADTVRVFYKNLREKRFREAIFLTNLRPAVEGLTDDELKEFQVDLEAVAKHVPAEIEINGEIISGDSATVTAKLPTEDLDGTEIQEIRLRKEGDFWVILSVDESAEALIKKEGKNYFHALKIETHEGEAKQMLDRIVKAQMAYSVQNGGVFADIPTLVEGGLLPADIQSSVSTGYNYSLTLAADKKKYSASAEPAVYGKTGKLSFGVELDQMGMPKLVTRDPAAKGK